MALVATSPVAFAQDNQQPQEASATQAQKPEAKGNKGVKVGQKVAWLREHRLPTVTGEEFTFAEWMNAKKAQKGEKVKNKGQEFHQSGGLLVVSFWSKDCPWQKKWDPDLSAIAREYQQKGVRLVAINSNATEYGDAKGLATYRKKSDLPFPILIDKNNKLADLFGAKTTPHIYLISSKGEVLYTGAVDNDANDNKAQGERQDYLRDALNAALAGKAITVKETKPKGCTIKRTKTRAAS